MKKGLILASCLLLILTLFQISKAYGVFQTVVNDDAEFGVAKWRIFVNNSDLNNNNNVFYVDNITYTNNSHVSASRFAPGVSGEFIIEIDPKNTEVAFKYELSVDLSNNTYNQIKIDSIEGLSGTNLTNTDGVYSRVFTLSEIRNQKVDSIKVSFSWDNEDSNSTSDSILGSLGENFNIPVNIKFSQYIE